MKLNWSKIFIYKFSIVSDTPESINWHRFSAKNVMSVAVAQELLKKFVISTVDKLQALAVDIRRDRPVKCQQFCI